MSTLTYTSQVNYRWPRITIVTPSFNQARFIEDTIRSVLMQEYPNLEYIVIDGGSTDGSVEIIKKYEQWLTYWVSEPDRGQSHAINKGFALATGDIMAWINSDDYYLPGAFLEVAKHYLQKETFWFAGGCCFLNIDGTILSSRGRPDERTENWFVNCQYSQPAVFFLRSLWEKVGGLDESLNFSFDYDLWMRFAEFQPYATWIDQNLAVFRVHKTSKTYKNRVEFDREDKIIQTRYYGRINSVRLRFLIWKLRKERKANKFLSVQNRSNGKCKKILMAFANAPWMILKKRFYFKIYSILRSRENLK